MNFFEDKKKQRFKFSGIFDELIIVKGKNANRDKYRVTFKNVLKLPEKIEFRNHVHILINKREFEFFEKQKIGDMYIFTAEVYKYFRKPALQKDTQLYYSKEGIGLKNINKIQLIGENND